MTKEINKKRVATAAAILLLLAFGPFSYSRGVVSAEVEMFDKYFSANIDLVPIMDIVFKDNSMLKATVKELVRGIEFRDAHIKDLNKTVAGQDRMIGGMADEILELENRPPEIVEVEKVVEVEVIREVTVYIERPVPIPDPVEEEEFDDGSESEDGDNNNDQEPADDPVKDPDPPDPPDNGDGDKHDNPGRDRGKGHLKQKGKGHGNGGL